MEREFVGQKVQAHLQKLEASVQQALVDALELQRSMLSAHKDLNLAPWSGAAEIQAAAEVLANLHKSYEGCAVVHQGLGRLAKEYSIAYRTMTTKPTNSDFFLFGQKSGGNESQSDAASAA